MSRWLFHKIYSFKMMVIRQDSLSKVVKAVVNSAYYLCRLGFLGAFRHSFRLGLCGGFCLGLQPFHFLLCGMESSVGVIVQRHYNVGVSHDVLQCLGVHARVCHSGTECMPHGVRRHHIGQRLLSPKVSMYL